MDFNLSTSLLLGATIQVLLVLILPKRYALTPAIILLAIHIVDVYLITKGFKPNPYLKGAIFKNVAPTVPDENAVNQGPGQEKVAILLLGAKSNHPMGVFSPDYKLVNDFITRMTDQLEDPMNQDAGCTCSLL